MEDELPLAHVEALDHSARPLISEPTATLRNTFHHLMTAPRAVLAVILVFAAYLNFADLARLGYGNTYYAAGVKSMSQSWHNFFFVSFDPGGFVTIDKPPLGFWLQVASVKIFGFHDWSLLLPEALAGLGSVLLVYYLVRRTWGELAGLLAAAAMTIMPVAIATNRSNIVDSVLVFVMLLGAWAIIRATETGQLRWLALAMLFAGLGFNVKMLEAYLAVPAFFALYFLGANRCWRTKVWHLALAGVVLLVVSLSWATAVDLTPASQRPYVGSSDNNSEYNLIFGYNGLNRLLSGNWSFLGLHGRGFGPGGRGSANPTRSAASRGGFGQGENGAVGPLRLLNTQLGGQASWLLALALIALLAAAWRYRPTLPLGRAHQSLLFWGVWLLSCAGFFSVAGFFHAYYLVMMTPPIAALSGIGLAAMWTDYAGRGWRGWLLPFALVAVALTQRRILRPYPTWNRWLSPAILTAVLGAALVLLIARFIRLAPISRVRRALGATGVRAGLLASALGIIALGFAPTTWAMETAWHGGGGMTPVAGPRARVSFGGGRGGFSLPSSDTVDIPVFPGGGLAGGFGQTVDPLTLAYLVNNQGTTKFLVAVPNAMSASAIILETGKPVMALGGFTGSDPILTVADLQRLINNGTVRYFMLSGGFGRGVAPSFDRGGTTPEFRTPNDRFGDFGAGRSDRQFDGFAGAAGRFADPSTTPEQGSSPPAVAGSSFGITAWVTANCQAVSSATIDGSNSATNGGASNRGGTNLYDCRHNATARVP